MGSAVAKEVSGRLRIAFGRENVHFFSFSGFVQLGGGCSKQSCFDTNVGLFLLSQMSSTTR